MQVLHTLTYFLEQSELALSLQRTRSRGDPTCDRSGVGLQPLHDVTALFNHLATADEEAAAAFFASLLVSSRVGATDRAVLAEAAPPLWPERGSPPPAVNRAAPARESPHTQPASAEIRLSKPISRRAAGNGRGEAGVRRRDARRVR